MAHETHDKSAEKAERTYNILVYGIEKKGLDAPSKKIKDHNYELTFDSFQTTSRFSDFDGVILFQGTFEDIRFQNDWSDGYRTTYKWHKDELDKREKELNLLLKNDGFACFVLCEKFIDGDRQGCGSFRTTAK